MKTSTQELNSDIEYRRGCGAKLEGALKVLGGRWKLLIIAQLLAERPMRFSDLEHSLPEISQKMLIQQLRDLEEHGLVKRTIYPEIPPRVEYLLTQRGIGLRPVLEALLAWTDATQQP